MRQKPTLSRQAPNRRSRPLADPQKVRSHRSERGSSSAGTAASIVVTVTASALLKLYVVCGGLGGPRAAADAARLRFLPGRGCGEAPYQTDRCRRWLVVDEGVPRGPLRRLTPSSHGENELLRSIFARLRLQASSAKQPLLRLMQLFSALYLDYALFF